MVGKTVFLAFLLFFVNCTANNTAGPSILSSEAWRCNDVATPSHIDLVLSKLSNGRVSASGKFYYNFYGDTITGIISSGSATIIDTTAAIDAQGTAAYPSTPSGPGASSQFNLHITGIFKNSVSRGNWSIQFSDTMWGVIPGQFTGLLQRGCGVTAL